MTSSPNEAAVGVVGIAGAYGLRDRAKAGTLRGVVRVLELVAPSVLELRQREDPEPGPGEVRLAVRICGICGSDLHGMDGSSGRRIPPVVMGHEASGVIDTLGEGVEGWNVGDAVTFDSTVWCGECEYCCAGQVNLCGEREVVGVSCSEFRRDGALAEFLVLPTRILHRLPEGMSFREAAFAEPAAVALHAVHRAGDVTGKTVLVVGVGMIGLLVVQALKRAGAGQVIAVDLDQERIDFACRFGADEGCVPAMVNGVIAADVVIEAVGLPESVGMAMRTVKKGGRVVLVGNLAPEVPLPLQRIVTHEIELSGSCAIAGEYPEALAAIAAGEIKVKPMISGVFPLERGQQGFEMARQEGAMKVMIRVGGDVGR